MLLYTPIGLWIQGGSSLNIRVLFKERFVPS